MPIKRSKHSAPPPDLRPLATVVNDDRTQLTLLSSLLRAEGFEAQEFETVAEALASLQPSAPPALIVTDLNMPGIDGRRFCRLLKTAEYKAFNHVPVLVVSATFSGMAADEMTIALDANAFLSAPVAVGEFRKTIQGIMAGKLPAQATTVLVADHDKGLTEVLSYAFSENGYQPITVHNRRKALDMARSRHPVIAVVDSHLPGGKKGGLIEDFRLASPDTFIIMTTEDADPSLPAAWLEKGVWAYLSKPFDTSYLLALADKACRERSQSRIEAILERRSMELRRSEEELKRVNDGLERRVTERSAQLLKTIRQLETEVFSRNQAEEALNESLYRQKAILDNIPDPAWLKDAEGRYLAVNKAWCDLMGKQEFDVIGKQSKDFFPADCAEQYHAAERRIIRSCMPRRAEEHLPNSDGGSTWFETIVAPLLCEKGAVVGTTGIARDITKRKRAEEALSASLSLRDAILSSAVDGIAVCSPCEAFPFVRFSIWNEAMTHLTGYTMNEINKLGWYQTMYSDPADSLRASERMAQMRSGGHLQNEEWNITRRDGGTRIVAISSSFLSTKDGSVNVLALMRDVTERKRAEDALRRSAERNALLLREIHHRVKNNLSMIIGLLHLQGDVWEKENPGVRSAIESLEGRIRSMALLHEHLYQTENYGKVSIAHYLKSIIHYVVSCYGRTDIIVDDAIYPAELNIETVMPCGLLLNELLSNVFKHAFPAARKGHVRVAFAPDPQGADDGAGKRCWQFSVTDDGVGCDKTALDKANSLGWRIIQMLCRQLKADLSCETASGLRFSIRFNELVYAARM